MWEPENTSENLTRAPESAEGGVSALQGPQPDPDAHLPEDLRVPWGWADLLLLLGTFVVALVISSLAVGAGLTLVAGARGTDPQQLFSQPNVRTVVLVLQQTVTFALLFAYLFVRVRMAGATAFWRTLGWRGAPVGESTRPAIYLLSLFAGAVLAVLVQLASLLHRPETPPPIEQFFRTRESIFLTMGLAIGLAPLAEETVFRGFLYPVLARTFGIRAGVLLTGTLFGLSHAAQLWGAWWQIVLLVLVGLAFTTLRAVAGSVTPAYFAHLGYNGALFVHFYAATNGFRNLPAPL
jgi:membrane protease YdiL (CAAX protease family)